MKRTRTYVHVTIDIKIHVPAAMRHIAGNYKRAIE